MKTLHKHAALIKAWADGATIEYQTGSGRAWQTIKDPQWDFSTVYRVKLGDKFHVLSYKPTTDGNGWTENRPTTPSDPAATQWSLGRTDGEGDRLFLFESYADADAACQAANKSLTNF